MILNWARTRYERYEQIDYCCPFLSRYLIYPCGEHKHLSSITLTHKPQITRSIRVIATKNLQRKAGGKRAIGILCRPRSIWKPDTDSISRVGTPETHGKCDREKLLA